MERPSEGVTIPAYRTLSWRRSAGLCADMPIDAIYVPTLLCELSTSVTCYKVRN